MWAPHPPLARDVKMYRKGRKAFCLQPGCKPWRVTVSYLKYTNNTDCGNVKLNVVWLHFYFCMYIPLYRRLCLHVTCKCKYFSLWCYFAIKRLKSNGCLFWEIPQCKDRTQTHRKVQPTQIQYVWNFTQKGSGNKNA